MAEATAAAEASASSSSSAPPKQPTACIVIGMAGSGKTTLMQRLNAYLHGTSTPYYTINLDPAVLELPFGANIDIRDTVNYKEVMKQYQLGPNGGILTSLNLFASRFEQVMDLVKKRADSLDYVLLDTPGQIEIFTWSASGAIISESLAAAIPTVILYVVDTFRCQNAVTFMSNMLHACSILYKMKLPLVLVFNKTDIAPCDFAKEWMADLESFSEALQAERSYMGSLAQSMALMLETFYTSLTSVGVSAVTGDGMPELFEAVDKAADEYRADYAVELAHAKAVRAKAEAERQAATREELSADGLSLSDTGASVMLQDGAAGAEPEGVPEEAEGYNAADEQYAADHPADADDAAEYEGLMRYMDQTRSAREARAKDQA